jgi:hypothetical protein
VRVLEQTVRIDAAPERVWAVLVDVERWPSWTTSVKKLECIDGGPLALGSRARLWLKGAFGATTWTVTKFTDGRSFTWTSRALPEFTSIGDHELTPDGDATNVLLRVTYRGALSPIMGRLLDRVSRGNLELEAAGLKRASEQR